MADKNLNIKVRAKGTKKAKKELKGVEKGMVGLGKAAGMVGAAFFAAKGLISGLGAAIELSGKQELAEKKLATALGKTSKALLLQASALQQVSMFGDEDIIMMQSMLASFVKGEDEIKLLTKATLDLAAGMGLDLKSAGDLVAKTIGSSTNAMSRYGIEVKGAVGSTERLETLTNNVATLFGGQALAQSQTMTGSIEQMKNAVGDAAEALGDLLSPVVITIAKSIKFAAEAVEGLTDKFRLFGSQVEIVKVMTDSQAAVEEFKKTVQEMSLKELEELGETLSTKLPQGMSVISSQAPDLQLVSEKLGIIAEQYKKTSEVQLHTVDIIRNKELPALELQEVIYKEINSSSKKAAEFAAQTASSMLTSAVMGDNVADGLKRAVIQLMVMVAQAKLYDFFMTQASGGLNKVGAGIVSFLFGASPTQSAGSASAASNQKITINQSFGGMGVIDHNFAANSIIPAINKAISTGQARIN